MQERDGEGDGGQKGLGVAQAQTEMLGAALAQTEILDAALAQTDMLDPAPAQTKILDAAAGASGGQRLRQRMIFVRCGPSYQVSFATSAKLTLQLLARTLTTSARECPHASTRVLGAGYDV